MKDIIKHNKNKKSELINEVIFVITSSFGGAILTVPFVVAILEFITTILNVSNIAIKFNFHGIAMNSFFNEVKLSIKGYFVLFMISYFISIYIAINISTKLAIKKNKECI